MSIDRAMNVIASEAIIGNEVQVETDGEVILEIETETTSGGDRRTESIGFMTDVK